MGDGKPTLHMLCGYMCAGKSTLAAQLGRLPRTIVISEDRWVAVLFGPEIGSLDDFERFAMRFRRMLQSHVVALLAAGNSVVLDMPANWPRSRRWMLRIAEKAGAEHLLHFIDLPGDLCRARLRERNASGKHEFIVHGPSYDAVFERVIAPQPEEGALRIVHYRLDPDGPPGKLKIMNPKTIDQPQHRPPQLPDSPLPIASQGREC